MAHSNQLTHVETFGTPIASLTLLAFFTLVAPTTVHAKPPVKIILDTDFGDDGDDLAALCVLHHLMDIGEVELLAVGQSNSRWDAPGAIDVINTYYGRPDIPIGQVKHKTHEGDQYSSFLVKNYEFDLDLKNVPSTVEVYRRALAEAPDKSVKFVVVGFKSSMRDLLQSAPDSISPLTGIELVRKKVTLVSDMAGKYPSQSAKSSFNFKSVKGAAKYYVENCPTPMIFAGVDTGGIKVGMKVRKTDTPVGRAMELKLAHGWKPGEKFQAGFDLASVLVAARGADRYFNTKSGCNKVEANGANTFTYDRDCGHRHIDSQNRKVNYEKIGEELEQMMLAGPKNPGTTRLRPVYLSREPRNLLLDAKVSGNLSSFSRQLRGAPNHLIYDGDQRRFVEPTQFHEYGVGFKEDIGVVSESKPARWMAEWKSPVRANRIVLKGAYSNQPQPNTAWKIELRKDGKWRTHARGVGGWYDQGQYVWGRPGKPTIQFDALRVSLFSKNDKEPLQSIHFRSEDGTPWSVMELSQMQVKLRKAKSADAPRVILDTDAKNEVDDQHYIAYGLFSEIELLCINSVHHGGGQEGTNFREIEDVIELSRMSGLADDRVPPVFHGANRRLERPRSGKWFDTQPIVTEASEAILVAARGATPEKPVWVLPVGPCTNIASAILQARREHLDLSKTIRICWLGGGARHAHKATFNGGNDPWSVYVTAQSGLEFLVLLENPTGASLTFDKRTESALYPDNSLGKYLMKITPNRRKALYDLTTISMVIGEHLGRNWLTSVEPSRLLGPDQDFVWKRIEGKSTVQVIRDIDQEAMKKDFFDTLNGRPTALTVR